MKEKILKLDSSGQPTGWLTWKEAVTYQATGDVAWSLGEAQFSFKGGHNNAGLQSIVTTASIIAIKGKSKKTSGHTAPTLTNKTLFARDKYMCAYCGNIFAEHKLSRDHVIARSAGGKDIWTNVVTACRKDNAKKDNKTLEQAGMKLLYVPYVPNKAEDLILKNRFILADQMDFLMSFVSADSPLRKQYDAQKIAH